MNAHVEKVLYIQPQVAFGTNVKKKDNENIKFRSRVDGIIEDM